MFRTAFLQETLCLVSPSRTRRLARAGVVILAVGLGVAAAMLWYGRTARGIEVGPPIPAPLPEPGSARPWEVEIGVSTYSSVHTRHGNLLTVIPITSWSGVGPDMSMNLYHNAANVNSPLNLTGGMGFNFGPGWTTSYSSVLIPNDMSEPTRIVVVGDDGRRDPYIWDGDQWVGRRPGVHDVLTGDPDPRTGPTYRLKHKNQSYHEYGLVGAGVIRLTRVVDAAGIAAEPLYDVEDRSLVGVSDAPGRKLEFQFDPQGRLTGIHDPHEGDPEYGGYEPSGADILYQNRTWQLEYDSNGRVNKVVDPMGYKIVVGYDAAGRITSITDKGSASAYRYTYDGVGHLATVTDPTGSPLLTQSFSVTADDPAFIWGRYTDRRGQVWHYD